MMCNCMGGPNCCMRRRLEVPNYPFQLPDDWRAFVYPPPRIPAPEPKFLIPAMRAEEV